MGVEYCAAVEWCLAHEVFLRCWRFGWQLILSQSSWNYGWQLGQLSECCELLLCFKKRCRFICKIFL